MAEHHTPGQMDITVQRETFDGFIRFVKGMLVVIFCILLILMVFGA